MVKNTSSLIGQLQKLGNKEQSQNVARFFKTGKGQYGEGDQFLGVKVPIINKIAKENRNLSLEEVSILLANKWHEVRVLAVKILAYKTMDKKINDNGRKEIFDFYLSNTKYINNWDLVDISAYHVVGNYLLHKKAEQKILFKLAKSANLWERRIAIISTFAFIRQNDLDLTYQISDLLLEDKHDLMHKAVGWMLREAGKKDINKLKSYLIRNIKKIPRTTLRYAIERFEEGERKKFLGL
jgi:3-methyladenine DNA glycosylase AlkD